MKFVICFCSGADLSPKTIPWCNSTQSHQAPPQFITSVALESIRHFPTSPLVTPPNEVQSVFWLVMRDGNLLQPIVGTSQIEIVNQLPPQALRFSHRRGKRETRVTGDEPQETMGRVAHCLLPAFLCVHIFIERETSRYEAGSDTSSVWNICFRFSDVISRETSGGVAKCRLFSQAIV